MPTIATSMETNMTTHIKKISDTTIDLLDKVSTSTSRAGTTIERAGKMYAKGVPKKVIAVQLTENSKSGNEYTETHVDAFIMLYTDAQTKVGITKSQATALIEDQTRDNLPSELQHNGLSCNLNN